MASTLDSSPNSPPTGGLVSLPAHVIWTNKAEKFFRPKAPPKPLASGDSARPASNNSLVGAGLDPAQRVYRLERSLRFLKTEHQKMLTDLHREVEKLKTRNKELQFQLLVGKPLSTVVESVESTVDVQSPKSFHMSSTQTDDPTVPTSNSSRRFSHLEEELSNLRQALDDAESRNSALSSLVSQLKRSHIKLKSSSTATRRQFLNSVQDQPVPTSYAKRFEEYEEAIRRLKKENVEQKHELHHVRTSLDVYRGLRRVAPATTDALDSDKLPHIAVSTVTRPNNQARKTTALPFIHPLYLHSEGSISRVELPRSTSEQPPRASTFAGPYADSQMLSNGDKLGHSSNGMNRSPSKAKRTHRSNKHQDKFL